MKSILRTALAAAVGLRLLSGVALADQKLGVEVYPGAQLLAAKSAEVNGKSTGVDASCYRTTDPAVAVRAFYLQVPGFAPYQGNVLRRGRVDVVIHSPATDPKTGAASPYAVFCIMQATG